MKPYRIFTTLLVCVLLLGLAVSANADDPTKSAGTPPGPASNPPPPKGAFDPVPGQEIEMVLDPATASVTRIELAEDDETLVPAPPVQRGSAPGPIMPGQFDGETLQIIPSSADAIDDLLIGSPRRSDAAGQEIGAASSTQIMFEDFESTFNPPDPPGWSRSSPPVWDDVDCFPIESGGVRSAWAADLTGLDPCDSTSPDDYANNMNSWLIYGPFSLTDARSAFLDFYFRMVSESCAPITDCDYFFWGASIDGTHFYGPARAGTYTTGPFNNGYNFATFDLADVYTLGDLTGQPQVWIAFAFVSNDSVTAQGPFIDYISLRKNTDPRAYLTDENFDVIDFPNQFWESFDNDGATNGDYRWDDVSCFARSDGWSMWPADEGAGGGLDPCSPSFNNYPNNAQSWLVHGPLDLTRATEAWVDFHFRNDSQEDYDYFCWMASADGASYSGFCISGTQSGGPHSNGYNLMRFDLSDPWVGDLRGEPEVWLAFIFQSDDSITGQGPFLDDVSVIVERLAAEPPADQVFLPVVFKGPAVALTNLYVQNDTTGNASYTVHNTPEGNITCNNIPAGTTKFCGSFTSGTYNVGVSTTQCGSNSGEVFFMAGDVTRVVRCVSN